MRMRWLAALALVTGTALPAAEPSPYADIPGIRFEYYDVEGRTPQEIYASMQERSPMRRNGSHGLGQTSWEMDVTWRESTRGKRCRVSEPKTRMSFVVTLPRLVTRDPTPEGLAFWRAVRRGLDIHEAGHVRIAWYRRDDFNKAAARARCKSINQVAKVAHERIAALQAVYDRETDSGRTQTPEWQKSQ